MQLSNKTLNVYKKVSRTVEVTISSSGYPQVTLLYILSSSQNGFLANMYILFMGCILHIGHAASFYIYICLIIYEAVAKKHKSDSFQAEVKNECLFAHSPFRK